MPALTTGDKTKLRASGHSARFYLRALTGAVVFAARVNGTPAKGATTIPFDGVTVGAYTDIVDGMTVLVGTTAGAQDVGYGRTRVKSATSSELHLALNVLPLADNQFITVLRQFLPSPKKVRVDGGDVFVDGDEAFTDQTQADKYPPVVIMGADAAALFVAGAAVVLFEGSDSRAIAVGASIASYAWDFGDGATSTSATPGAHTYTAEGHYIVTLSVTDSLGNVATSRRNVVITTEANAYTDFEPQPLDAAIGGGARMAFTVRGDCDVADFPKGCPVIFFADEYYGAAHGSIGWPVLRSNVKFFGYVDEGSITKDPFTSEVSFSASTVNAMLGRASPFPVYVADAASAGEWSQAEALTVRRALFYLLYWHSTIMQVADVWLPEDETLMQSADFPGGTLWEQLTTFAETRRYLKCGVTRQGALLIRPDPNLVPTGNRFAIAETCQLLDGDWTGQVDFAERDWPAQSFIQLSGVTYDGDPAHEVQPLFAKAPGYPDHTGGDLDYGDPNDTPYFQFVDIDEAKAIAGNRLAQVNAPYGDITLTLDGNWSSAFEPARQEYVRAPAGGFVTQRGTLLAGARLIVTRMSESYDTAAGMITTAIICEAETSGPPGEAGDYPAQPPPPPVTPPPEPPPPPPDPGCPFCDTWRSRVYISTVSKGIFYTDDFAAGGVLNGSQPTWVAVNTGLAALTIRQMIADPHDPNILYATIAAGGTNSKLYRKDAGSSTWTLLIDALALATAFGASGVGSANFAAIGCNINAAAGYLAVIVGGLGTADRDSWFFYSNDYGATWNGGVDVESSGTLPSTAGTQPLFPIGAFQGASATGAGHVYYAGVFAGGGTGGSILYRSTNDGTTWAQPGINGASPAGLDFEFGGLWVDPSNHDILWFTQSVGGGKIYKFSAQGAAYALMLNAVGSHYKYGLSIVYNPAGDAVEIRAFDEGVPTRLYRTVDGGASWSNNAGAGLPSTGNPFGLSIVQDSSEKLYGLAMHSVGAGEHVIFASANNGSSWQGKAGADVSSGSTTGIPFDCGGVSDIVQIWTDA